MSKSTFNPSTFTDSLSATQRAAFDEMEKKDQDAVIKAAKADHDETEYLATKLDAYKKQYGVATPEEGYESGFIVGNLRRDETGASTKLLIDVKCVICGKIHTRATSDLHQTEGVCPECREEMRKKTTNKNSAEVKALREAAKAKLASLLSTK